MYSKCVCSLVGWDDLCWVQGPFLLVPFLLSLLLNLRSVQDIKTQEALLPSILNSTENSSMPTALMASIKSTSKCRVLHRLHIWKCNIRLPLCGDTNFDHTCFLFRQTNYFSRSYVETMQISCFSSKHHSTVSICWWLLPDLILLCRLKNADSPVLALNSTSASQHVACFYKVLIFWCGCEFIY